MKITLGNKWSGLMSEPYQRCVMDTTDSKIVFDEQGGAITAEILIKNTPYWIRMKTDS